MNYLRLLTLSFLLFILSCTGEPLFAQSPGKINDSLFRRVTEYVNAQNADGLYELLNDDFKAKFSRESFTGVLKNNLYPLGPIKEYFPLPGKDGVSSYKAVCDNAELEFRLGADKSGKVATLRFLPYKEPVGTKNYRVATDNPMKTALDSLVDTVARQYINKQNTVGISIGILKNNVTTYYGYGSVAKENNRIPGPDAIFEIGSVTKTFTATLLAYHVVQQKIALSDPIVKYLPDSVATNSELKQITLEMLSNHTSGLPRLPDNIFDANTDPLDPYKKYTKEKLFAYLKNCKLVSVPGEKYAYSNLAAGLLGTIMEGISGKTYEQMVSEIICTPLGMKSTYQHPNEEQKNRQVSVYNAKGDSIIMWNIDGLAGAGAIRSTTHDMLLYARANIEMNTALLSRAIQLTHKLTCDKEMKVGLGWHLINKAGSTACWHNGATGGSSSNITCDSERHIAVVVLSNSAEDTRALNDGIYAGLLQ